MASQSIHFHSHFHLIHPPTHPSTHPCTHAMHNPTPHTQRKKADEARRYQATKSKEAAVAQTKLQEAEDELRDTKRAITVR